MYKTISLNHFNKFRFRPIYATYVVLKILFSYDYANYILCLHAYITWPARHRIHRSF